MGKFVCGKLWEVLIYIYVSFFAFLSSGFSQFERKAGTTSYAIESLQAKSNGEGKQKKKTFSDESNQFIKVAVNVKIRTLFTFSKGAQHKNIQK